MRKGDAMLGWLIGLVGAVALVAPAAAEVRIHLFDKTTPVVTDQIFEEEGWVLYQEGDSGYLFSVPRERVEKVEIVQGGAVRTIQMAPSEQATSRDSRRQVLLGILGAENKEADAVFKRLQEELRNMQTAISAARAVSQPGAVGAAPVPVASPQEVQMVLALHRERISELFEDASVVGRRIDRIFQQAEKYKSSGPKPRYHFYR